MEEKEKWKKKSLLEVHKELHASLAAKVVQTASKYAVDIELHYNNKVIDLKSILALMSLAVPHGENVRIVAIGLRSEEAIKDISSILG
jgi:phosphocarrier protein HPr